MKSFLKRSLFVLAIFAMSAMSLQAATLEITSVRCVAPQERDANGDELRLRLNPKNAARKEFFRNGVRAGINWAPGAKVTFHGSIHIELHEIDSFPSLSAGDEQLGSATLTETPRTGTLTFNRHGSHYVVSYRVVADKAFSVKLVSLRCVAPQERDGDGDDLRMGFKKDTDTSMTTLYFKDVRAGRVISINRTMRVHSKGFVKLVEEDGTFNSDEVLGDVSFVPRVGTHTLLFNRHGSHYVLTYSVVKEQ